MQLYTLQLSRWREAKKRKIPYLNITVRNGHIAFAPSWHLVACFKAGSIDEAEYTKRYKLLMQEHQVRYQEAWEKLLSYDTVAVSCFCATGTFCHRLILKDILETLCLERGLPFSYMGEI